MLTRTITITPGPNIQRESISTRNSQGTDGFMHSTAYFQRPYYKFTMQLGPLQRVEAECLSALHAWHKGSWSFYWDGGIFGGPLDYTKFATSDGVKKTHFLPHRNILTNSFAVRSVRPSTATTSNWTTAAYTVFASSGLFWMATVPVSGDELQAKYQSKYRLNFAPDGFTMRQIAPDLYTADLTLTENPTPIPDPELVFTKQTGYQVQLNAISFKNPRIARSVPIQRMALRAEAIRTANFAKALSKRISFTTRFVSSVSPSKNADAGTFMQTLSAKMGSTPRLSWHAPFIHVFLRGTRLATPALSRTLTVSGGIFHGIQAVGSGATTATVTTGLSNSMHINVTPQWNTTWWTTSLSATQVNLGFNTQVGSGGSFIDWGVIT